MQADRAFARPFYLALGFVFLGLGYVGVVTPLMPGTIFFILALWAFKRSSPKFEDWLLHKSFMGPTLRDWERERSIRLKTKIYIMVVLWSAILLSSWILISREKPWYLPALFIATAAGVSLYIWTRKTRVDSEPAAAVESAA